MSKQGIISQSSSSNPNRPNSAFFKQRHGVKIGHRATPAKQANTSFKVLPQNPAKVSNQMSESPYGQLTTQKQTRSISQIKLNHNNNRLKQKSYKSNSHHYIKLKNKGQLLRNSFTHKKLANIHSNDYSLPLNASLQDRQRFQGSPNVSASNNFSNSVYLESAKISPDEMTAQLLKELKDKAPDEKLQIYRKYLDLIVENDKYFKSVIWKVRDGYDQLLANQSQLGSPNRIKTLENDILNMKQRIEQEKLTKKQVTKKIEKFKKENIELSKTLEDREIRFQQLQDRMFKVSKVDLSEIELNEQMWKSLTSDNQEFVDMVSKMRSEIKALKRKEKRLIRLVLQLKKQGYPVEEAYEEDVRRKKKRRVPVQTNPEPTEEIEEEEYEPIAEGPPKVVRRPDKVPPLMLEKLPQSESFSSSSEFESGSEEISAESYN